MACAMTLYYYYYYYNHHHHHSAIYIEPYALLVVHLSIQNMIAFYDRAYGVTATEYMHSIAPPSLTYTPVIKRNSDKKIRTCLCSPYSMQADGQWRHVTSLLTTKWLSDSTRCWRSISVESGDSIRPTKDVGLRISEYRTRQHNASCSQSSIQQCSIRLNRRGQVWRIIPRHNTAVRSKTFRHLLQRSTVQPRNDIKDLPVDRKYGGGKPAYTFSTVICFIFFLLKNIPLNTLRCNQY